MVPPRSDRISRVPPYSRTVGGLLLRGYHALWPDFPDGSDYVPTATGLVRVRSPLLAESRLMSFPPVTEMFQFTGFASRTYGFSAGYPCGWVAPFGYPRIKACSRLPVAFRRVPRPSSPLCAKASTRCPSIRLISSHAGVNLAQNVTALAARLMTCATKRQIRKNLFTMSKSCCPQDKPVYFEDSEKTDFWASLGRCRSQYSETRNQKVS